jgi:hypothetical protein
LALKQRRYANLVREMYAPKVDPQKQKEVYFLLMTILQIKKVDHVLAWDHILFCRFKSE